MLNKEIPYNDLPLITSLNIDEDIELRRLVEDTRVSIELLNYVVNTLPTSDIIFDTISLQEAKVSANIENDLYKAIGFKNITDESKEVAIYRDALFIGFNRYKEKGVLSSSDIVDISMRVNTKLLGISSNLPVFSDYTRIANVNSESEMIYTPYQVKEAIQALLVDMLEFVYNDESYIIHPLIKIALAHYQFARIHPFVYGNGITGRILDILFICQKGYLSQPILYSSFYIMKNKTQYYSLIQECKETQNYNKIIRYMLESFKITAEKTLSIIESVKEMVNEYTKDEFLNQLNGNKELLLKIIDLILKKTYVRIVDLVESGLHRQTAAVYLDQFVDLGVLTKAKVGRENIYRNTKLMGLFEVNRDNE